MKTDKNQRIDEVAQNLEVMLQAIKMSDNEEAVEYWIDDFEVYIDCIKRKLFVELFDNE